MAAHRLYREEFHLAGLTIQCRNDAYGNALQPVVPETVIDMPHADIEGTIENTSSEEYTEVQLIWNIYDSHDVRIAQESVIIFNLDPGETAAFQITHSAQVRQEKFRTQLRRVVIQQNDREPIVLQPSRSQEDLAQFATG